MSDSYERYEAMIEEHHEDVGHPSPYWSPEGAPQLDYGLLKKLLTRSVLDGDSVQSGGFVLALDMWIAEELRCAGFDEDAVWPRLHAPHVLDPSVLQFISRLPPDVAEECCEELPAFSSNKANVLGIAYKKQVDVGLSSWMTGPEILISTKTMRSSFGKNLANRFEEAYGDAKNLKGRHPLAVLGFYFLVDSSIAEEGASLAKAIAMLEKLQTEADAYDVTCLHLVGRGDDGSMTVSGKNGLVPNSLSPEHFYAEIIKKTLLRASPEAHGAVRDTLSANSSF